MLLVDVREPNEIAVEAYPDAVVRAAVGLRSVADSRSARQAGGVCLPLRQALGHRLARRAGRRPAVRFASGGRHPGLESGGAADQNRIDRSMLPTLRSCCASRRLSLPLARSASAAAGRRAEGARAQRLQLVGLCRPGGARGLHQGDRHQGALRHLRFQRHAGDQAARRQVRLRRRGADRLFPRAPDQGRRVPEARQVEAAEPRRMSGRRSPQRLATYDPGNHFAVNYMWGTTGIGYNVKKAREILGGSRRPRFTGTSCSSRRTSRKFKDCGVHMLDSADDIMPAALHYLGLDPNSHAAGRPREGRRPA